VTAAAGPAVKSPAPAAHLVVVSAISACAMAVAVAAAGRSRDGSLVLLALGCLAVGLLMLGHGLTTPGIWGRPPNLWVGRLPVVAIAAFAACLCAAAWPRLLRDPAGLEAGRGSHFDPACLDAFLALMAERGHRPGHGSGDPALADAAAEACHDQPHPAELAATPPR
jgi:hypothetical protein